MDATDQHTHTDVSFHWISFAAYRVCVCVYIYIYMCVCVCVCVRERERERPPPISQFLPVLLPAVVCSISVDPSCYCFNSPVLFFEIVLPFLNDFISTGKKSLWDFYFISFSAVVVMFFLFV